MNMEILAGAIGGLITGLVGVYVALRMLKPNIRVAKSEEQANLAQALKDAVDSMLATSADRNKLEERLDELEAHRDERNKELAALRQQNDDLQAGQIATQRQIEALNRDYTRQIAALQTQIADWKHQYSELKEKYHRVVEVFAKYLKDRGETVPDDLAHLLGDTLDRFKLRGEK